MAAKGAVEIGQVAETNLKGDRAHRPIGVARIDEQSMRSRETASKHELGK